ncbi:MAG: helix-turn-helix transcriptional regulator, partial [Candidatus Heimdallarchaeaceae archaeon]
IVVSWIFANVSKSNNPFFLLRFDKPIIPETDEPFFRNTFNIFWIGIVVGVFLGISGTSWLIRYREKQAMRKLGRTLLTDTQKALIKIVYDHKGKISQRELCDITGYSKSKISRNLVPLEMRGLIRREKWGRTYVVYLTDDGQTVIE